ncbi:MAG: hypothetical protein WAN65_08460 [Candidatus Sulfotelmatobacter sp.]
MTEELNGAEVASQQPPKRQPTLEEQLDMAIWPILNCLYRGITVSFVGIPPEKVMESICRSSGRVVGMSVCQGDLVPILKLRKGCKEAFAKSLDDIQVRPLPMQPKQ